MNHVKHLDVVYVMQPHCYFPVNVCELPGFGVRHPPSLCTPGANSKSKIKHDLNIANIKSVMLLVYNTER